MLSRSEEIIPIMLGILRIGATLLPIDKEYPEERIKYIIKNSKCNTLFADSEDITYDVNVLDVKTALLTKRKDYINPVIIDQKQLSMAIENC